jgi:hypothetical protein
VHQINDEIIIAEVNMLIDKVLSTVKQAKEWPQHEQVDSHA